MLLIVINHHKLSDHWADNDRFLCAIVVVNGVRIFLKQCATVLTPTITRINNHLSPQVFFHPRLKTPSSLLKLILALDITITPAQAAKHSVSKLTLL